jgi:hypothetical protein
VARIRAYSLSATLCKSITLGLLFIVIPGAHQAHDAATMTTVMDAAISAKTMEVEEIPGDKVSIEPLSTGPYHPHAPSTPPEPERQPLPWRPGSST